MLYLVGLDEDGPIKIGHSCDPRGRLMQLQMGCPHKLIMFAVYGSGKYPEEQWLHEKMAAFRLHGEWFNASVSKIIHQLHGERPWPWVRITPKHSWYKALDEPA